MRRSNLAIAVLLSAVMLSLGCPLGMESSSSASASVPTVAASVPAYDGGYGYDAATDTMYDHNGFAYSYMPDGVIRLELPWGYTTHFSYGLTATYLGTPQTRTALDYAWSWATDATEAFNDTGVSLGWDYRFTASNLDGVLDWTIMFEFSHEVGTHMKVTHVVQNQYANALEDAAFWYLFDLQGTATPYTIETSMGVVEGPLYEAIPDGIHWVRLSNEFQFDWRDALEEYDNGMAYIGDGAVVGLDGLPILGISLELGDLSPGEVVTVDPYFSGVTRTWNAAANSYSGIAASWDPVGVPATGDNITFDGTSVFNCNWNTSVTLGDFSMLTGYSGTVSQASTASFAVASFSLGAGTFTGSTAQWITLNGSFSRSGTSVYTAYSANLRFLSAGTDAINYPNKLDVRAAITFQPPTVAGTVLTELSISSTGSISIASGNWLAIVQSTTFINLGTISAVGTGYFLDQIGTTSVTRNYGVMNAPITMQLSTGATASRTFALSNNHVFGGTVSVNSLHASYTATLNTGIYSLKANGIVIGTRGIIISPLVESTGAWSSSAGTFTPGTSTVTLSGTGSTVTTGTGQSFYNLVTSGTYTTASSLNVTHNLTVSGGLTLGAGKTCDWNTTDGEFSNTGTIAGTGTLALTMQDDYSLSLGTVTCPTIVRKAVDSTGTHTVALAVDSELAGDFTVESGIDLDPNDMVVTIADDLELNLPSPSSLWNVTVEAGVTVTLTVDVVVELRATILGTVAGADFLEPEPAFTSTPDLTATPLEAYDYAITQAYWDALAVVEAPAWLYYLDGSLVGVPAESDAGFANVSLSLTWNDMTTYQNWTIFVAYPVISEDTNLVLGLVLSLILGFGTLVVGLIWRMHSLVFFSGLVWLLSAFLVAVSINIAWVVLSIGLGMLCLMTGGMKLVDGADD